MGLAIKSCSLLVDRTAKYRSPKRAAFRVISTLNVKTRMRSNESDLLSVIFRHLAQRSKPLGSTYTVVN